MREVGKQMMRPCLKFNNTGKQKENIFLIREVIEGIQESQTSELNFKMSRSLPSRHKGRSTQCTEDQCRARRQKKNMVCSGKFELLD